ncbi:MAG: site-specific integrase [Dehalococcoidia bacterium]|nr:site-specific integrase [Dehalococcoidia bacterium]
MRGSINRIDGKRGTTWQIVVDGEAGADGSRKQVRRRVKGSRKLAESALRDLVDQAQAGTLTAVSPVTVAGAFDQWAAVQAQRIRANTFATYRWQFSAYIGPRLGNMKLRELSGPVIQALLTELSERGGRTGKPLSRKSVHHVYRLISTLSRWCVRQKFIGRNPCDDVQPPRFKSPEIQTFNPAQLSKITAHLGEHAPWAVAPVLIGLLTGLRRSEILALQWFDLSLDSATPSLSVRRGVTYLESQHRLDIQAPKTSKSARAVALSPQAVAVLRGRLEAAEGEAAMTGKPLEPSGWVFGFADGSLPRPDSLSRAFTRACRAVGVPGHFHALRHSHASVLIGAGVPLVVVQRRLGHSTIATTADVYGHIAPDLQERAAALFDGAFKVSVPLPADTGRPALPAS